MALSPLIAFQIRVLRVPRPLAVLATLVFGCAVLMVLGGLISVSVGQLAANTDVYQRQINQLLDRAMVLLEQFGFNPVTTFNALTRCSHSDGQRHACQHDESHPRPSVARFVG